MEVTTVSPSPASPTEGDDLCEIDGTDVAIHSVTLLISPCGLVGNGAVLCLLSLKLPNTGIFELAFADFLFLVFTIPSALIFLVEDVSCSPIMPLLYLSFLFQLSLVSSSWALFRLMFSINHLNMYKLCMLRCHCNLPKRLLWLLYSVQYWAFFSLSSVILSVTNLCPSRQHEHCRAVYMSIYIILLIIIAVLVFFSRTDFKRGSRRQQPKRRYIVLSLIVLFILPLCICNFLQQFGFIVMSPQGFFLLTCIQSSIKPFIYFLAGRCWSPCALSSLRLSLQRVFDEHKKKPAAGNHASVDTGLSLVIPSTALLKDPGRVAEGFLEPSLSLWWCIAAGEGSRGSALGDLGGCSAGSSLEHGFPPPSWMHMAPSRASGLTSVPQLYSPWNDPHCLGPRE